MPRLASRRPGFTRVLLVLALIALGLRAVTPTGYMVASPGGAFEVTLCTGHGPATISLDLGGDPSADKPGGKSAGKDAPCLFAAAATLAPPATPPALSAGPAFAPSETPLFAAVSVGRGLAAPPPWATGPPATT